ncbi:hypothetical protein PG996_004712 [Apiospora saccharicola]|uniref:BHLH domain-containing protein n=1 Tax=Apiospora saccharicola TaxID=335842 RepID=A0ABR1W4X3_9PEZI
MPFSQLSSPPPIDDDMYYSSRLPGPLANLGSDDAPLLTAVPSEPLWPHFEEPIVSDAWMTSFLDMPHADFVLFPDYASSSTVSDVQDGQATPWSEAIPMSSMSPASAQTEEPTLTGSVADLLLPPDPTWQPRSDGMTADCLPDNVEKGRSETTPPDALPPENKGEKLVRRRCSRRPQRSAQAQYQHHLVSEQRYRQSVNQALRGLEAALPDTLTVAVAAPLDRGEDGVGDGDADEATDKKQTKKRKRNRKREVKPANKKPLKATKADVVCRAIAYIEQLDQEYMEWEAKNTPAASMIVRHHWALVNKPANTFII